MPIRHDPEVERLLGAAQAARQSGQPQAAERIYLRLLQRWPEVAPAHNGLGLLYQASQRLEMAVSRFEQAIALDREHAPYYNNLGMVLRQLQRYPEAEQACREAIRQRPDYPEAWNNLGNVHFAREEFALARAGYREAIRHRRGYAKAWLNLARAEWTLKRFEATRRAARRAIRLRPGAPAWALLAQAESELGRYTQALAAIEQALALAADPAVHLPQKAGILRNLSRYGEALALQQAEVEAHPDDPDAWNELGLTLDYLDRLPEAEQAFNQAIVCFQRRESAGPGGEAAERNLILTPEKMVWLHQVRLNRTFNLLKQGKFDQGWSEYASRWDARQQEMRKVLTMPRWQGEPLAGKHLIVATEQGLGDTVQFARYLPILLRTCPPARLTLATTSLEAPLFAGFPGIDRILLENQPMPAADYYCLLLDLPLRFQTRLATIPARVPYFTPDAAKAAYWEERVRQAAAGRFTAGLAWQGNPKLGHDHHRSFPLAVLEPLFDLPGICWIKLQKGAGSEQAATGGYPIVDLAEGEDRRDLMDTAALMQALDLVITADSMPAHLAGALAHPVWVPLASRGEWRWLTERADSPWYPTLRLFRQPRPGDWDGVAAAMRAELSRIMAARADAPLADDSARLQAITRAWRAGRRDEALAEARRWLDRSELGADSLIPLAELLRRLGDVPAAFAAARRAVEAAPERPSAHNNLGLAFLERQEGASAVACFERALACDPGYARALHNLAKVRIEQGALAEAEALLRQALERREDNPWAWTMLGGIARRRHAPEQALRCCGQALRLDPDFLRARLLRAELRQESGQAAEAERELRRLLEQESHQADVWIAWGQFLERQRRQGEALAAFEQAARLKPLDAGVQVAMADLCRKLCDWRDWPARLSLLLEHTRAALAEGRAPILPALTSLRFPTSPAEQLAIAAAHARRIQAHTAGLPPLRPARHEGPRLRIGLLSHEFQDNVVGHLLRHLPAAFDRHRFEIHAFVYNPDDGSAIRRDLLAGCDYFHDLTAHAPWEAAQCIAGEGIAVLLDINPYMQNGRPEIAALRPAPIQVSYLYPGTMGAPWIDYLLADEIVVPPDQAGYFQEKPAYLPSCYLPCTGRAPIAAACPNRAAYGLPETGLVFCSFNKEDKIDPECFAAWMRILREVADAVLWLAADEPARAGLRRAAAEQGVAPARLVFAGREPDMSVHLARQRHADLFLDTFIHNAHATAADALWAGLPILTRTGSTHAGRVAASLLRAAGLAELIAGDGEDYVRRAVALARDRTGLAALRRGWEARREDCPLFRAAPLARHLERAFEIMWERHRRGEPPAAFRVAE